MPHGYSFSDLDYPGARLLKSFVITRSILKVEHTVFEGNLSSCFPILFFYSRFRFLKESACDENWSQKTWFRGLLLDCVACVLCPIHSWGVREREAYAVSGWSFIMLCFLGREPSPIFPMYVSLAFIMAYLMTAITLIGCKLPTAHWAWPNLSARSAA